MKYKVLLMRYNEESASATIPPGEAFGRAGIDIHVAQHKQHCDVTDITCCRQAILLQGPINVSIINA
jgi:hypothetical protein